MKQRISNQEQQPRRKKKAKNRTLAVVLISVSVIFVISAVVLISVMIRNKSREKPEATLPTVAATISSIEESETETEETEVVEEPPEMLDYMKELYDENPDIVGYLHIDGTNLDTPVVYTAGEDYYLYRGFDGEEEVKGCPFVDKYNTVDPRDANLIIHGHHTSDGTVFTALDGYKNEDFYKEHKIIRYDSLYEEAEYEVIASFISQVYNKTDDVFKYYKQYDFKDEEEFSYFLTNIRELSLYDTGVDAEFGDEFITLSTCEYTHENGRMVVVARKINQPETSETETSELETSE